MKRRRLLVAAWLPILGAMLSCCAPRPLDLLTGQPPMVFVPGGQYIIGSDSGNVDERPAHRAWVNSFYIDKYEVTNGMYLHFVDQTGYPAPDRWSHRLNRQDSVDWRENLAWKEEVNKPATWVSWRDAAAYARWRGCRLPTELEWEVAARGSSATVYPWGNRPTPVTGEPGANIAGSEDGFAEVAPVGSFASGLSIFGALDMSGNVWEWVADWYLPAAYDSNVVRDAIHGVQDSLFSQKVIRGGSWLDSMKDARTTVRRGFDPAYGSDLIGFRCARSADEPPDVARGAERTTRTR